MVENVERPYSEDDSLWQRTILYEPTGTCKNLFLDALPSE